MGFGEVGGTTTDNNPVEVTIGEDVGEISSANDLKLGGKDTDKAPGCFELRLDQFKSDKGDKE